MPTFLSYTQNLFDEGGEGLKRHALKKIDWFFTAIFALLFGVSFMGIFFANQISWTMFTREFFGWLSFILVFCFIMFVVSLHIAVTAGTKKKVRFFQTISSTGSFLALFLCIFKVLQNM